MANPQYPRSPKTLLGGIATWEKPMCWEAFLHAA
jgi:hypothetical protein